MEPSVSSHFSSSHLFAPLYTSSHIFALPSFILFRPPAIMRFSTLIAFMLPLSALGQPIGLQFQSDIDFSTKVFVDGFNLARSTLANMALATTRRVKIRQIRPGPPAVDTGLSDNMLAAINQVERILDQTVPVVPTDIPSEQECVDPPPH